MTKIGVFSDVHGNLPALEAALAALQKQGCEEYLCAGDLVGIGPCPEEVTARLRQLPVCGATMRATYFRRLQCPIPMGWTRKRRNNIVGNGNT